MLIAKVYKLNSDGKYQKVGDFDTESYTFEVKDCKIEFNFYNIFKRYKKGN